MISEGMKMKAFKRLVTFALVAALSVASAATVFAAAKAEEKTAYTFTYNKQQVKVGDAAAAALKKLGDYKSEQALANCADSSGTSMNYTYDGFYVITEKVDGKNIVKEITLTKDTVATEEGLKVGDAPADVKKIYAGADANMGLYTVTLGDTKLIIDCGIKDEKVETITYEYAPVKK